MGFDEGAVNEGGGAAGGDAEDDVEGGDAEFAHGVGARSGIILDRLKAAARAVSPPAMMPTTMAGSEQKVGGHSAASRTPRRPEVPAPT